jgi:hypothetical protein
MAQQDLGGSCTAQRYCHSLARISEQVLAEQEGVSAKKAMMRLLAFMVRKRQSSYNQSGLSMPLGGVDRERAVSRVIGLVVSSRPRV